MKKNKKVSRPLRIVVTVLLVLLCVLAVVLAIYSVAYDVKKQSARSISTAVSRAVPIPPSSADTIPEPTDVYFGESAGTLVFDNFALPMVGFSSLPTSGSSVASPSYFTRYLSFSLGQNPVVTGDTYYALGNGSPASSGYHYVNQGFTTSVTGLRGSEWDLDYTGYRLLTSNLTDWTNPGTFTPITTSYASLQFGKSYEISMVSRYSLSSYSLMPSSYHTYIRFVLNVLRPFDISTLAYFRILPVLEGETTPDGLNIFPSYTPGYLNLFYRSDPEYTSGLLADKFYSVPTKLVFYDANATPIINMYYYSPSSTSAASTDFSIKARIFYYGNLGVTRYNSHIFATAGNSEGAYTRGFDAGYVQGYDYGLVTGETTGFEHGQSVGYDTGFSAGYSSGVAHANNYSFVGLITAIVDAPVKAFQSMFNFEILGFNMSAFLLSLLTLSIALKLISLITGNS